jgi:hypothetical protein
MTMQKMKIGGEGKGKENNGNVKDKVRKQNKGIGK